MMWKPAADRRRLPAPANLLFKTVHEHILIASKPPAKKVGNRRALPYEALMA